MRALIACAPVDEFDGCIDTVLASFWERGLSMPEPAVLASVLMEARLDTDRLLASAQTDDVKAKLADNSAAAVERGAFGVPTFLVGDEMFFGKERLGQIEALLASNAPGRPV